MPLAPFELTQGEYFAGFQQALDIAAVDCASGIGVEYVPSARQPPSPVRLGHFWGVVDADHAARWGFGAAPDPDPDGPIDPGYSAMSADERAAFDRAMFGDTSGDPISLGEIDGSGAGSFAPGDGCYAEFLAELNGSLDATVEILTAQTALSVALAEARSRTMSDERFLALAATWSSCMAERGFGGYENPAFMRSLEWPEPRPTAGEIDAALADVACKESTGFVERAIEIEAEQQAVLVEERQLDEALRVWQAAVQALIPGS